MDEKFDFDGFLDEAKGYIEKDKPVQASEKLYKCAEEVVKLLAEKFGLPEYLKAKENDKWNARLLFGAVGRLSEEISKELRRYWAEAWFLHTEGFHERRLSTEEVRRRLEDIEELTKIATRYL